MRRALAPFLLALVAPAAAMADEAGTEDFVAANLIAILYHELGHALVDVMALPIFGQEEDAADVLSVLLIHEMFEEESAVDIAYATAAGFLGSAVVREAEGAGIDWWDTHAPDLQRYYTHVCLFYGADPEAREDVAADLGLPGARAETCADEFDLADASWGPVLDELYAAGAGRSLRFAALGGMERWGDFTAEIVAEEVAALNAILSLPVPLDVVVTACGEANAFYDPERREVLICTDFAADLSRLAPG